jgi:hypothetical protein
MRTLAAPLALALSLAIVPAAFAQAQAPAAGKAAANASNGGSELKRGMTVKDGAGKTLGAISKISKNGDGSVREVLVTALDGETHYRMAGAALSVSGDVAVTATTLNR